HGYATRVGAIHQLTHPILLAANVVVVLAEPIREVAYDWSRSRLDTGVDGQTEWAAATWRGAQAMDACRAVALADELQAHLDRGDLISVGSVYLGPDGTWADVELATRIMLADVTQRLE